MMVQSQYDLKKDDDFFVGCLEKMLIEHKHEYVLIHDAQTIGFFKSREEAVASGKAKYKYGEYLVSKIENKEEAPKFVSFRYAFI